MEEKTALTSHVCKVADLLPEPIQSLIPPSGEVNGDDTADKSLSGTSVPPITQPKAPTAKRPRKKKIPSSTHLELDKEFVVTVDATKSLDAFKSGEVQGNQLGTADAEKIIPSVREIRSLYELYSLRLRDQNIGEEEDSGVHSLEEPTFKQLMDEVDKLKEVAQEKPKNDINVIDITPKYDEEGDASDSDLHSMPSDNLASLTGFETPDLDDEASISVTKEHSADNLKATLDGDVALPNASAGVSALSDPLGHLQREKIEFLSSSDGIGRKVKAKVRTGTRHVTERLDSLQGSLLENSDCVSDLKQAIKDMNFLLEATEVFKKANAEGEKWEKNNPETPKDFELSVEQFTKKLFTITSFSFAPSPSKELTPPRDPSKGKGIAIEEPMKELIPYIEEGGSDLKKLNKKPFVTAEGELSQKEYMAQIKEMKILANLKATKEESEKSLRKIMNPATVKAQTLNLAAYEEKRQKMLDEYNNCIYDRVNPLPITKIHYKAKKLGTPPLPELAHFGKPIIDKKRKRSKVLTEVFVKENITVDGMKRNLIPPPGVEGRKGLVIKESEEGIFYYNGNFDLALLRVLEFHLSTTVQLVRLQYSIIRDSPEAEEVLKGLSECKASEGNFRRIQVKDIVKEVEDYLKTYSSAGMDISWYVEGIR
ncbi:hypothetical protein Tco_0699375 [Tanacetum coccineum]